MANLEKKLGAGGLETWVASDERTRVELVPGRGGLITRWSVDADDVLYLDESTLVDPSKNVRGGIPLLFPFAGKPPPGSSLGQHGFARKLPWEMVEATADEDTARLECQLTSTPETRAAFPHDFTLRFAVTVAEGRLALEWQVTNTGASTLPLHFGLHPYFRVPLATKGDARLDHEATRAWDNLQGRDVDVPPLRFDGPEVDLHLLDHPRQATTLHRGDGRKVVLSWTPHFTAVVVWTLPGKDFVCVEPWTAPGGALGTGLARPLAPGAVERLAVVLGLD